ncbi:hypothetical protein [Streptomyces jumonjinensis]|uniref:hypothetical protein n=1 Tax=Streptomyces jumonjinensis TaxID=1945 RepID=UPI0037BDFE0D
MEAHDQELAKELHATLHARRELGEEYDSALVESFLSRIEERLDGTLDRRERRLLAERQMTAARGTRPAQQQPGDPNFGERFGFGIISLILAVPLTAISVVNADLQGLIVTWTGIVAVNAVHASGALSRLWRGRGRGSSSDWEE